MKAQLKRLGFALDWSRELATCDPAYYGHEQALFVDLYEAGLVYRKESAVNWDPVDQTVLANEQVIDGKGWRSGAPVEKRKLSQWFLKITDFAEELLDGLGSLEEWPEKVRLMQENWIGKSTGLQFSFKLSDGGSVEVYSTRPDTIFGASFVAVAPDHPIAQGVASGNPDAEAFIEKCKRGGTTAAELETAEKLGFDTGITAVHPFSGAALPVYIANFVLMDYGTGAIMAVPGHDQRDFEFATKYGLPIVRVVASSEAEADAPLTEAEAGDGVCVNSDFLNGMTGARARPSGACATGVFRASVTGARRSRSSIAPSAASWRCRRTSSRSRCPRMSTCRSPAIRWCAIPPGSTSNARSAAERRSGRPTRSTRSSTARGISCASPASRRTSRSTRPKSPAGCPSISTSAASSTRSCTCSTPASGPARSPISACST
jgi:leucyl-tRNA synthetase